MLFKKIITSIVFLASCFNYCNSQIYLQWVTGFGSAGTEVAKSVFKDANDDVYTTGYFTGTVDFDPGAGVYNLTSAGSNDIFILKQDKHGVFQWAVSMGSNGDDKGLGIAVDPSAKEVFVTGYFNNTCNFEPAGSNYTLTSYGAEDAFLAKLDASNGSLQWAHQFGGSGPPYNEHGNAVCVDANGDVYLTGFYEGKVIWDPPVNSLVTAPMGQVDFFVLKYDAAGNFQWLHEGGGAGNDVGTGICEDIHTNNILVTGYFEQSCDFDNPFQGGSGAFINSAGQDDGFILSLKNGGGFNNAVSFGGSGSDRSYGIAYGTVHQHVYTTGYFSGTASFNPQAGGTFTMTSAGGKDIYVSMHDASLGLANVDKKGSTGDDEGRAISIDSSADDLYSTGYFTGTCNFDPFIPVNGQGGSNFSLVSSGGQDSYILVSHAKSFFLNAVKIGGGGSDIGHSIVFDSSPAIYVCGEYGNACDFDPTASTFSLTSAGGSDFFVAKYHFTPLPIELVHFDAEAQNSSVKLNWITATERNNAYFVIEKTKDGITFEEVTKVKGANNSNSTLNYEETDAKPYKGLSYYRLKQIDFDGKQSYSELKTVLFSETNSIEALVFPNPAHQSFNVLLSNNPINTNIELFDVLGKSVLVQELNNSQTDINMSHLNKGVYYYKIKNDKEVFKQGKLMLN